MKSAWAALVLLGAAAFVSPALGDDDYRDLFCTKQSADGIFGIYTVHLRIPKSGGGACKLVGMSPTSISDEGGHIAEIYYPDSSGHLSTTPPPSWVRGELSRLDLKDLGTLTTKEGGVVRYCRLLTFQKDGVIVVDADADGVLKLILSDLDTPSRQKVEAAR